MLDVIAFDADDTPWHHEPLYARAQQQFVDLLKDYEEAGQVKAALYDTEMRNLEMYGYGIKSFTLSMIETAVALSGGQIQGGEVLEIIEVAKRMLRAPVEPLDGVDRVIPTLASSCRLMLITKGDLRDQQAKLACPGLASYFWSVEIVREKTTEVYHCLLAKHGIAADRFLMVGNSLRSDVLPVVALGGEGCAHTLRHHVGTRKRAGAGDKGLCGTGLHTNASHACREPMRAIRSLTGEAGRKSPAGNVGGARRANT